MAFATLLSLLATSLIEDHGETGVDFLPIVVSRQQERQQQRNRLPVPTGQPSQDD